MEIQFFVCMNPPTATAQQHRAVATSGGKTRFFDPPALKAAREKLTSYLGLHVPLHPLEGPVRLVVKWCFPRKGRHRNGEYKTSRPDTDNLQKLLKDVMTSLGYWKDDAQVASEIVEKFWADVPGLLISVREMDAGGEG